ncbi:MAG: ABC transporter ATP-binding protein [Kangiellaceae bacterium]|nr:ABC transporter ATP-binding protein [Kangiellaceae bacterium]MCW8998082.1 ABC transporter ATP-binding protein [Kangiellaceae bacterium]
MVISVEKVSKSFRLGKTKVEALSDVSFSISRGEFCVIRGVSGSGKSTLLNLMGAMDTPTKGKVVLKGINLGEQSEKKRALLRRDHIGFVFQAFNLIPVLTSLENVMYPLTLRKEKHTREKAKLALSQVGLEKFVEHKPVELSGGQMQRVAIARALVSQPDIILADEPTANLDSQTAQDILDLMLSLNREVGTTFVIATHHQYLFDLANRVIEMRDGELIANDEKIEPIRMTAC